MRVVALLVAVGVVAYLVSSAKAADVGAAKSSEPAPFDYEQAKAEVNADYSKAHPEIQEYILWTAQQFGPGGFWLNEDAFADLPAAERNDKALYIAALLEDGEYGRHLCPKLAEAGAIKDDRLVPGLMKVAGHHEDGVDYDCRAKWMATASLARQESDDAVPLLISLVDHGNQNTRMWARAALSRHTGQDFKQDKQAWADWWKSQGHGAVDAKWLKPYVSPQSAGVR